MDKENPEILTQCVTASKKLIYKKLQAEFLEKLYPYIRN